MRRPTCPARRGDDAGHRRRGSGPARRAAVEHPAGRGRAAPSADPRRATWATGRRSVTCDLRRCPASCGATVASADPRAGLDPAGRPRPGRRRSSPSPARCRPPSRTSAGVVRTAARHLHRGRRRATRRADRPPTASTDQGAATGDHASPSAAARRRRPSSAGAPRSPAGAGSRGSARRRRSRSPVEPDEAGLGHAGRRRCAACTRARTSPMSAHTSSAEPPSSAWMKLACLGDTSARPEPQALAPGGVDQPAGGVARRVGEHRAGVLAARLVRPPPPHDLGDLGLARGAVAGRERQLGPHDDLGGADRRVRGSARSKADGGHDRHPRRPRGRRRGPSPGVAAMSEPCPPAFMRTAPPIEPGTPTAHSNPVSPAAAVRRATTGRLAPPPGA